MTMFLSFFDYSSYHPLNYIFSALLLIIYYRSVIKKNQRLGDYYRAFQEYTLNSNIFKKINPILLLSIEFIVTPMLIFPGYVRFASLLIVFIQLIYICLMFSGKENVTDINCGCYVTLPRFVNFTTIFKNISILFLGLLNFLIFYL